MMEQNKVRTYFFYAIGEIVLVMIGILLALQVNNWNEDRNNRQKAEQLAGSLIMEFNENLDQLDNLFSIHASTKNASMYLLSIRERNENVMYNDALLNEQWSRSLNAEFDEEAVMDTLWNTYYKWTFDPLNGALRSGISSGDINFFKNDTLKAKLFAWEDLANDLDEEETRLINSVIQGEALVEKYVPFMYLIHKISDGQVPPSNFIPEIKNLIELKEFENYLTGNLGEIRNIETEMRVLQEEARQIIRLLEQELEN